MSDDGRGVFEDQAGTPWSSTPRYELVAGGVTLVMSPRVLTVHTQFSAMELELAYRDITDLMHFESTRGMFELRICLGRSRTTVWVRAPDMDADHVRSFLVHLKQVWRDGQGLYRSAEPLPEPEPPADVESPPPPPPEVRAPICGPPLLPDSTAWIRLEPLADTRLLASGELLPIEEPR